MIVELGTQKFSVVWKYPNSYPVMTECCIKDLSSEDKYYKHRGVAMLGRDELHFNKNTGRKIALTRAIKSFPKAERTKFWQAYYKMRNNNW